MPTIQEPEFEVLPPERPGGRDALPRLIALFLDNLVKLPGTKARIGLNPFLDFLPLIGEAGDIAATFVSAVTILEASRRGVPKIVLARMSLNILLGALAGVIPGLGGAFAFWFKPSTRNYHLLQAHTPAAGTAGASKPSTANDWLFVTALLIGLLVAIGVFIGAGFYISYRILHALLRQ